MLSVIFFAALLAATPIASHLTVDNFALDCTATKMTITLQDAVGNPVEEEHREYHAFLKNGQPDMTNMCALTDGEWLKTEPIEIALKSGETHADFDETRDEQCEDDAVAVDVSTAELLAFEAKVVIEYAERTDFPWSLVTKRAEEFKFRCASKDGQMVAVLTQIEVQNDPLYVDTLSASFAGVTDDNVTMVVADQWNFVLSVPAQVSDELKLRLFSTHSHFNTVYADRCFAAPTQAQIDSHIGQIKSYIGSDWLMVLKDGCPKTGITNQGDGSLVGLPARDGNFLDIPFSAFQFQTHVEVHFACSLKVCAQGSDTCQLKSAAECAGAKGRRKRFALGASEDSMEKQMAVGYKITGAGEQKLGELVVQK